MAVLAICPGVFVSSQPTDKDRQAPGLIARGWRWLRSQQRDAWFHTPLTEATAPAAESPPESQSKRPPRAPKKSVTSQAPQPLLFAPWQLELTPALKKTIKADVAARLPEHAQPSAAQWKMIFSTTPATCVVAGAGAGKSTSLVLRVLVLHHYMGFELDSMSVVTFTRESRRDFIKKLCQVFDMWGVTYVFEKVREVVRTYHSLVLPLIHALPGLAEVRAFENLGAAATGSEEANPFQLRLNDIQRQLMNECYRSLMSSDPSFSGHVGSLRASAAQLRKLDPQDPDVQKRLKALSLASARDAELCDLIEEHWRAQDAWPIKGIKIDRQAIDIKGFTFHTHGYTARLNTWVVLGFEPGTDAQLTRPTAKIPIWGEWAVKRTLFQAFCDKPLIWLDNPSDAKKVLTSLNGKGLTGPGFEYQLPGELTPAPLLDCFVAAATFIENLGLQVVDAIDRMSWNAEDSEADFFAALRLFWPALEAHLQNQTPPVMLFNRMFALLGEGPGSRVSELPDDALRPMSHLLVDEFQDISAQIVGWLRASLAEILRRSTALAGERAAQNSSLMCVGDDWQSIYGWRGSNPSYFMQFNRTFSAHKHTRVLLIDNYRSHQAIIDAAEHIVASAPAIPGKKALARRVFDREPSPVILLSRDLADLARRAAEHHAAGDSILVLYRRNSDRQALAEHIQGLLQADQALPAEQRRLRQLTFHSAKGLQADAVFLLGDCQYASRSPYKNQVYALAGLAQAVQVDGYDSAQHEEALRLAYVGITRAIHSCYWYVETAAKPGARASDRVDARMPCFNDVRTKPKR
ncbi:UvrD-helicase domain-containing protein [Pseudomonas sp. MBT-2]|uniref:UvrD-helicase domain-containing protein n=1 Tax=Pseudomonas baltica TaxID=2762576 RepID=A0A7X1KS67_9PSED|nr:UvrD-helicase domain-containing protein [Pseudomonas baltica]